MPVDIETRRLKDHTDINTAYSNEELTLDSSTYGTRNITVGNLTRQINGDNNISSLGDGTPSGAILAVDNKVAQTNTKIGNTDISEYADGTVSGILANFAIINVTIPANGWSNVAPYTNAVNVAGITSLDKMIYLGYVPSNTPSDNIAIGQAASRLDYGITGDGTITWYALENKPPITFSVALMRGY